MDHAGGCLLWPSQVEDRVVPPLLRPRGSRREAGGGRGQAPRHRRAHGLCGQLQAIAACQGSSHVRKARPFSAGQLCASFSSSFIIHFFIQVTVSSRQEEMVETRCVRHDRNPVYEEGFTLLVSNPELDDLNLKVYDERYRATLGLLRLNLANLVNRGGMEYLNQPFKLKNTNGCESSVILSLQLFFTKKVTRVRPISEDFDTVSQAGDLARYQREKKLSILSGISVDLEDDAFIGQDEALTLNESAGVRQNDDLCC